MSIGTCMYCRRPVTTKSNSAIQVTGWMVNNSLKEKQETGQVAHRTCLETEYNPADHMEQMFKET